MIETTTLPKPHTTCNFRVSDAAPIVRLSPTELTAQLRELQPSSQAKRCGSWIGKGRLTATGRGNLTFLGSVSSCRSPRCPRCRVGIMAQRKDEIQTAIDHWQSYSPLHHVTMLTLTVPHVAGHSLKRLRGDTKTRKGLAGAVARLKERALWKRQVEEFVSGTETTDGPNGWHPHYHILIFHTRPLELNDWYEAWAQACVDAGLGRPSRAHGLTLQPAESAAAYMAKWGLCAEITGQHVKDAKHGNRSLFALEQLAAQGDKAARRRLQQYLKTMVRKRNHTFSRGLTGIRTRHRLEQKPAQTHFVFDKASSYRLHEDHELRACLLQVLEDYQLPATQVFSDLGLVADPVLYPEGEGPQFPYETRQRAERLLEKPTKYPDVDAQCLRLLLWKQKACKSVVNPDTLDDLLTRLAAYDDSS